MHAVVVETEADHQRIHLQIALERADDRDRAARADHRGLLSPLLRQSSLCAREGFGAEGQLQRRARAERMEVGLAIGGQARAHEVAEAFGDRLRILLADETERKFRARLGRQHGFRTLARIAAPHAVHVHGRARPDLLEHAAVLLARRNRQADFAQKCALVEIERAPLASDILGQVFHAIVEIRQRHAALRVVQVGDDLRQHVDRIDGRAAVEA